MTKDIEIVLDDVEKFFKANLNAELLAIDAEKAPLDVAAGRDLIVLKPVPDGAYFNQTLDDRASNFDPFILLQAGEIESQPIGPATADNIPIGVFLALVDQNTEQIDRRVWRYQRALKTLVTRNFARISGSDKFKVTSLVPVSLQLIGSSAPHKLIGIDIRVTIV